MWLVRDLDDEGTDELRVTDTEGVHGGPVLGHCALLRTVSSRAGLLGRI